MVKQAGVTSKGRSEFVQEITFQKLTPGSVIAFRYSKTHPDLLLGDMTSLYLWFINHNLSSVLPHAPPHRVSLDPKSQKMVGVLRYFLSQFSPKYRKGSAVEDNPPEALQKPLAQ